MIDPEKPFKEGHLWLPPKSKFLPVSKSWQKKFCRLFSASKQGIERIEIFDNEDDLKNSTVPIVTLENCVKICEDVQKNKANVFAVITKSNIHLFAASSQDDMLEWIVAFQSVAFRDNVSTQTIEEDNDLYCSSGDTGVFSVKLLNTEASKRCGLECDTYTLIVATGALQLKHPVKNTILVTWPYQFIRRYGCKSGKFTFEAGRKCSTGEGFFNFERSNEQEIFHCISAKMKDMKMLLSIQCGDSQLTDLLKMVPRSRSPLPPSPTSSTPTIMESIGSMKHLPAFNNDLSPTTSERLFLTNERRHMSLFDKYANGDKFSYRTERRGSTERMLSRERSISNDRSLSSDKTLSPPTERPPPPPPKPKLKKPEKPPRKNLPPLNLDTSRPYDDVEVRSDAWKTLGVNNTPHSERPFVLPPKSSSEQVRTPETQKLFITTQTSFQVSDYDKLQHLGTTSRITSPGYSHVRPSGASNKGGRNGNCSGDELDESSEDSLSGKSKRLGDLQYNSALICKPNHV